MRPMPPAIRRFLDCRRIAVAGVSRRPDQPANAIFRKLRDAGYEVFAVNPQADELEGVRCYPNLASIPRVRSGDTFGPPVDAVMIVTHPNAAARLVEQCGALGIRRVWIHRSLGTGSVSEAALAAGRRLGIEVIAGACPLMWVPPVDPFHRCLRVWKGNPPVIGPAATTAARA